MANRPCGTKLLSEPVLAYCQFVHKEQTSVIFFIIKTFLLKITRFQMSSAKWRPFWLRFNVLTHWGRVTHVCVSKLTIIGSDNGLSPSRRQAIIWTNAGILLIRPSRTNFNDISIKIYVFSFIKMHLKMSSAKCRPFCLSLNVLTLLSRGFHDACSGHPVHSVRNMRWSSRYGRVLIYTAICS